MDHLVGTVIEKCLTRTGRIAYLFHVEQAKELARWSADLGVPLSLDQLRLFQTYLHELTAWNRKTNLTSITQPQEIIVKHFVDSIACNKGIVDLIDDSELLDVGSGAGFPGLPLKIVCPELIVTLLEPASKKTSFLRHMIGTLHLTNVQAIPRTLQAFAAENTSERERKFSYIISRALNMTPIIRNCLKLLDSRGRVILCRSRSLPGSEDLGGLEIENELSYDLPCEYGHRVLSILKVR